MAADNYVHITPHIQHIGGVFFQTWRLKDSIPASVIKTISQEYEDAMMALRRKNRNSEPEETELIRIQNQYFQELDDYLDSQASGPVYLKQAEAAEIVIAKLREYDGLY
jgi:putative transposase